MSSVNPSSKACFSATTSFSLATSFAKFREVLEIYYSRAAQRCSALYSRNSSSDWSAGY